VFLSTKMLIVFPQSHHCERRRREAISNIIGDCFGGRTPPRNDEDVLFIFRSFY
jgi:hypothetical protein